MDRAAVVAYLIQSFILKASFRQRCMSYVSTVIRSDSANGCDSSGWRDLFLTEGASRDSRTGPQTCGVLSIP